jgi:hypothetical protein
MQEVNHSTHAKSTKSRSIYELINNIFTESVYRSMYAGDIALGSSAPAVTLKGSAGANYWDAIAVSIAPASSSTAPPAAAASSAAASFRQRHDGELFHGLAWRQHRAEP